MNGKQFHRVGEGMTYEEQLNAKTRQKGSWDGMRKFIVIITYPDEEFNVEANADDPIIAAFLAGAQMQKYNIEVAGFTNIRIILADMLSEVQKALIQLGYNEYMVNRAMLQMLDDTRAKVRYMNSELGIYDFIKHTFVD